MALSDLAKVLDDAVNAMGAKQKVVNDITKDLSAANDELNDAKNNVSAAKDSLENEISKQTSSLSNIPRLTMAGH